MGKPTGIFIRWIELENSPCTFPACALPLFPRGEVRRIERFVHESDRRLRYAAAGMIAGLVHDSIGETGKCAIERDRYGRFHLTHAVSADISVSHSGEIAVCALASGGRIGIDIERVRPVDARDFETVLPAGLHRWLATEGDGQAGNRAGDERFMHAWTRLESVIKADGRGLGAPLEECVFDGATARLAGTTWHVAEIPVVDGYVCTLAADSPVESYDLVHDSGRW